MYVDLDPIPGVFHTAASAHEQVLRILQERISHYNPEVTFGGYGFRYKDQAIRILPVHLEPGGWFHGADVSVIGWYCVKSDDPRKRDLYLPPHIFKKCFRWVSEDHDDYPHQFSFVEEIDDK
jgi:hypothetical protein